MEGSQLLQNDHINFKIYISKVSLIDSIDAIHVT